MSTGASSGDAAPEERLRRSWRANADAWTEAVRGGYIPSRRAGTDAAILAELRALPPGRLLDVGCGEGWLARAAAAEGWTALGVDGSPELIERAREAGGAEFRVLAYERLAEDPARPAGPWDAAVCNFALLGETVLPLLRALRRLLAPKGRLLIQTVHPWAACGDAPYHDGWRREEFAGFGTPFREPMPWYFRTLESWVAALGEAGLRLDGVREPSDPETGRPLSLLLRAAP